MEMFLKRSYTLIITFDVYFRNIEVIDLEVPIDPGVLLGDFCRHIFPETLFNFL